MVTRSKFYYPAAFHRDADETDTLIPWVSALPLQQFVVDPAVVLSSAVGEQVQGLYVYDGIQWRFGLPTEAISAAIINGDTLDVFYNLTLDVTLPVRASVYKNGQLQPDDTIRHGNAIYVALTPPAGGAAGAVTSVNNQTGDVFVNASNLPGLAPVGVSNDYNDLINKPSAYQLPTSGANVLGGVIVPSTSNLVIDGLGNIDLSPTVVTSLGNKIDTISSVGGGVPLIESRVGNTVGLRSLVAGTNIQITPVAGGLVIDSTASASAITLAGDVVGTGTGTINTVLANSGVVTGTYTQVTVDAKGRITAGANPTTLSGYNITDGFSIHGGSVDGNITMTGGATVTGLLNPTNGNDAANKSYVDNSVGAAINGVKWRDPVRVATTANIALNGLQTIDSFAVQVGDRVLAKNQTDQTQNGVYIAGSGAWARSADTDTGAEILNMATLALSGTVNGFTQWTNSNSTAITVGTTNITFAQLQGASQVYSAGTGLTLTGATFAIAATGVTAGAYSKVTVNTQGQVIVGSQLVAVDISNALGYTPYNGGTNPAGFLTAVPTQTFTGDVTGSGSGAIGLTLTTSGVTAGTYTKVTVDLKGRVTAGAQLSNAEINAAIGYTPYNGTTNPNGYIGTSTPITLTGDVTGSGTPGVVTTLSASGVVAGTYTKVTVDAKGRVTVGASLAPAEITAALGFTPVNKAGDTLSGALNFAPVVSVVSAASTPIGAAASNNIAISGATTITAFDAAPSGATRRLRFVGTLTLTNGANLVLPTGANIITAANDVAQFTSLGGGTWTCDYYQRANGQALVSGGSPFATTQEFDGSATQVAAKLKNASEIIGIVAAAPAVSQNFFASAGAVQYYTANATANWGLNFAFDAATSLNTAMATGEAMTLTLISTQGASPFIPTSFKVDGVVVTPRWQGGSAPASGNAVGLDVYTFVIIKTNTSTFTVMASASQFK
jgi:phage-related tail fiber protein